MNAAGLVVAVGLLAATAAGATAVVAAGTQPELRPACGGGPCPTEPTTTTTTLPQCPLEPCGTNPQGNTTTTGETTSTLQTTTLPPTSTTAPSTSSSTTSSSSTSAPTTSSSVAPTSTTSPPSSTSTSAPPTTSVTTSSTLPAPSSTTTTTTLPTTLDIGSASTVCTNDVPFVTITFGNQPEFNGLTGTITFVDLDGNVIETHAVTYQANTTITLLYPGATVDANGNATDWPGWMLNDDGFWVLDPSDARFRDGLTIVAEINPTATTTISYPPSTAACDSPEGPFPPTTPPAGALPPTL